MAAPLFLVQPGYEGFAPTPARDGDAGGDVRVFCPESQSDDWNLVATDEGWDQAWAVRQYLAQCSVGDEKVGLYCDGRRLADSMEHRDIALLARGAGGAALCIAPGGFVKFRTGFRVVLDTSLAPCSLTLPVLKMVSRSGLANNLGIAVQNSPGIIDYSYSGEVIGCLRNDSRHVHFFTHGARVAQVLVELCYNLKASKVAVDDGSNRYWSGDRGNQGHGSTGT